MQLLNTSLARAAQVLLALAVALPASAADPAVLVRVDTGDLPVIVSAPHGGQLRLDGVAVRSSGVRELDSNTYQVADALQVRLRALTGRSAHLVAAHVSRDFIDFNRVPAEAYESAAMEPAYARYYGALGAAVDKVRGKQGALLIDIHGQSAHLDAIYRGTHNGRTADVASWYGPGGFFATLSTRGMPVTPDDAPGREHPHFTGGNIVQQFGRANGGIDAVQIELGRNFRRSASDVTHTADVIAEAILNHLRQRGALP